MADENVKKEVFISYCTKNKELAQLFCNVVEGAGVSCWMAPRDIPPGGRWATAISDGIEKASIMVLLVSKDSMSSAEVEKEVDLANGRRMTILPIRIEETELLGAFKYHLSNKQWIDALENDPLSRYNASIEAVLQNLGKETSEGERSGSGYLALARILANVLNKKYSNDLSRINSMFSAKDCGGGIIEVFFPFRLGATGVDLKCQLNISNQTMSVFVDCAVMDDPLKRAFNEFSKEQKRNFPRSLQTSNRREKITIFEPAFHLAIGRCDWPEDKFFGIFGDNVIAFFEKTMPDLIEWALYGQFLSETITELFIKLRAEFPEWKVGAPEGERLDAFNSYEGTSNHPYYKHFFGKINIYKEAWVPKYPLTIDKEDSRARGILSFTLESRVRLLEELHIEILKYEPWYELGDLGENIFQKADSLVKGQSGPKEDKVVWCAALETPWRNSGLSSRSQNWQGKRSEFVKYCVDFFRKLIEALENDMDHACHNIPELQNRSIDLFPPEPQQCSNGMYIYNRLRLITAEIAKKTEPYGFKAIFSTFNLDHPWTYKEIYLKLKVANFDAVAAFKCNPRRMAIEFKNLDPPDFETKTIQAFITARKSYIQTEEQVSVDFDGGAVALWFDRFENYVVQQVDKLIPEFIVLKKHLEEVVKFTESSGVLLSGFLGNDWNVINEATSLEPNAAIKIWRSSWRNNGAKDDDLPPLMLQIIPTKPCFDGLIISLRQNEQIDPQFEHKLGMVCGACEFAFGQGHDAKNRYGFWSATLPKHSITGGSNFDTLLIAGDAMSSFENYLNEMAKSINRIEPLISSLCNDHNDLVYFIGGMNNLIDGLTKSIEDIFPAKDGWKITSNAKSLERWASIRIFKETWKRTGHDPGTLTIAIEAGQANFDDLYYGIIDIGLLTTEEKEILRKQMNDNKNLCYGRQSNTWPWYKYAEWNARLTGGRDKKVINEKAQEVMQKFFRDKLSIIKTDIVPEIIAMLVPDTQKD
ncbi:MAG: toll/interleukin-1 receptor domain-containing protein [Desulfuromonadales bacterium]